MVYSGSSAPSSEGAKDSRSMRARGCSAASRGLRDDVCRTGWTRGQGNMVERGWGSRRDGQQHSRVSVVAGVLLLDVRYMGRV
jgi:hypothetical protein